MTTIPSLETKRFLIPISGDSPLLVHNFGEKARKEVLDIFQNKKKDKKSKDPQKEYLETLYHVNEAQVPEVETPGMLSVNGPSSTGFPVNGFKKGIYQAARLYHNFKMTEAKQSFYVQGVATDSDPQSLVLIYGDHQIHEAVARVKNGGTDLRYRAMYLSWKAWLDVTVVTSMIDPESFFEMVDIGGATMGVGDWRPQRDGTFGTYSISGMPVEIARKAVRIAVEDIEKIEVETA